MRVIKKQSRLFIMLPVAMSISLLTTAHAQTPPVPAGAILNQLNQNNADKGSQKPLSNVEVMPYEAINFVGDDNKLVGLADKFQQRFIGKKVTNDQVIQELNAYVQKEHGYAVTFLKVLNKERENSYGYIDAIKFDGIRIQNNSRMSLKTLEDVLNYKIKVGDTVDVAQLERNTTLAQELPGIAAQYAMVPGKAPNSTALEAIVIDQARQTGYLGRAYASKSWLYFAHTKEQMSHVIIIPAGTFAAASQASFATAILAHNV